MQKIHDFEISPVQYFLNGQDNDFPVVESCPYCNDVMIKHGFYERFVITLTGETYIIFIRRYRCKHCDHTISILPSFLLPQFQRSLGLIFRCLEQYFLEKKYTLKHRQVHFYCHRFRQNIPGIISFFRDTIDKTISFGKRKAIKLIEMIKSSPAQTFARRFNNHFNKDFMAL